MNTLFTKITNPKTGRKVSIYSKIGTSVITNYLEQVGGHNGPCVVNSSSGRCKKGLVWDTENCELSAKKNCQNKKNPKKQRKQGKQNKKQEKQSMFEIPAPNHFRNLMDNLVYEGKITTVDHFFFNKLWAQYNINVQAAFKLYKEDNDEDELIDTLEMVSRSVYADNYRMGEH